jgi:hypothetical protein
MRITHDTKRIIELGKPLFNRRSMQEPIRRHGEIKVPVYKAMRIIPREHHTERRIEFRKM